MDMNEMMEKRNIAKLELAERIASHEKAILLVNKQKEAIVKQFEAIKNNPSVIKEQARYHYELSEDFIEARVLMEEVKMEQGKKECENSIKTLTRQLEQMKEEMKDE